MSDAGGRFNAAPALEVRFSSGTGPGAVTDREENR